MLLTAHALAGAAIGVATGNPIVGFAGGLASHYLLDTIPHTDPGTWHFDEPFPHPIDHRDLSVGFADLGATFFTLLLLAGTAPLAAAAPLAGIAGAILPDVVGIAPLFFRRLATVPFLEKYYALTVRYHRTVPPQHWYLGLLTQAAVILGSVWYLLGS